MRKLHEENFVYLLMFTKLFKFLFMLTVEGTQRIFAYFYLTLYEKKISLFTFHRIPSGILKVYFRT